ncbi:embryogenic cell protein 40-like [Anoplophora glabripennis]|uniref:embryogenic cell protein 40-like n=1 Tax=Anoplophora glabripennis TaxID=217634 RepID=UPI00087448CC|nr:embryogenic cell protein 40-like [Anoplophora glabripennis]
MNALVAATFAFLAVSASAAPSGHGLVWGGINPHALSPVGPSGVVTGHGASGPSGVVTGAGAAGPSGIVTGALSPVGPSGVVTGHGASGPSGVVVLVVMDSRWVPMVGSL